MKKIFIAAGVISLIILCVFAVVQLTDNAASQGDVVTTTNNVHKSETEINVDGWLKITKIYEYDGRLALVAENVSDADVEYAVLTAKIKDTSFSFNISVLLRGIKVVLLCNEAVGFDENEIYTGWQTENVVYFEKTPVMNEDKFEVSVADGSISVKNVSDEDITSDVIIYYKDKDGDMLNGSMTGRVRISGIKANSQTYVNVDGINKNNCQIIFTEYDDKKV